MTAISLSQKRTTGKKKKGSDTGNFAPTPIIVVPGVMGTRLQMVGVPPSTAKRGPDWDPDNPLEMLKWVPLRQRTLAQTLDSAQPIAISTILSATAATDVNKNTTLQAIAATFGPGTNTQAFYEARGWGGVAWGFYANLLIGLETTFNTGGMNPVHAFGYDWRQSNANSGPLLAAGIKSILAQHGATKCFIVSHSMGGLVTRSALLAGATPDVRAVVHCVQPAQGAVVAYRRFMTGSTTQLDGGLKDLPLQMILGVTPLEYTVTQARLPGPLELLPTNDYPGVFVTAPDGREANTRVAANSLGDVYSAYSLTVPPGIVPLIGATDARASLPTLILIPQPFPLPPIVGPVVQIPLPLTPLVVTASDVNALLLNIAGARAFHASVRNLVHPNTALLFGDTERLPSGELRGGKPTDVAYNWLLAGSNRSAGALKSPHGDGTVPMLSARFDGAGSAPERQAFSVEHSTCYGVTTFMDEVKRQITKFSGGLVFPRVPPSP